MKYIKYKRFVMFIMGMVVLALHTSVFWFVWDRFYADVIIQPFYRRGNWLVVAIYVVMLFAFSKIYGGYKIGTSRITEIIYSQAIALMFTNVLAYAEISLIGRYFMWPVPMILLTIAQIALVVIWACAANAVYYRVFPPRKMLLIYGSTQAERLMKKIKYRPDKYLIREKLYAGESYDRLTHEISKYTAVLLCDVSPAKRNKIMKYCYANSIRVYMPPKLTDIIIGNATKLHLFDTPLYLCRNEGLSLDQRLAKRLLDLILCLIALVIASPFMIITAICIKLYDRGPIIYKQKRLTVNGRIFKVYKFRSMIIDAEKDGIARLASENDNRITPVGKIIRKIRFDELPQLFNILKGDMSFVGPRPERPEIAKEYRKDMPEFDFRLKVKAGLTGYAQVLGKYNTVPYDKLKLDLIYIEGYSIFLDLKLILMTLKVLFISDSTAGIEDGTNTPLDGLKKITDISPDFFED